MISGLQHVVVTPPPVEPITLAEAKALGVIDIDTDDTLVENFLIPAARARAEGYLNRVLVRQQLRVTFDLLEYARRDRALVLPVGPVIEITRVGYRDDDGNVQEVDPATYRADLDNEPVRIFPRATERWPTSIFELAACYVEFVAGYPPSESDVLGSPTVFDYRANVPPDIKLAIAMDVAHFYEHRKSVSELALIPTPHGWDSLLWRHRLTI